ncbi:MAG: 2'-5' RNA ligase family protein [Bacteroidota bacterium]
MSQIKNNTRQQLTLFLDQTDTNAIEAIRKTYNPLQYQLIASHITLCREDEIENLDFILENLRGLKMPSFTLNLEPAKRFSDGKGVYIPVQDEQGHFQKLRVEVLKDAVDEVRFHHPHLTIMHPRNSTCTNEIFEQIQNTGLPERITINKISLIEQEIGAVWNILEEYELK